MKKALISFVLILGSAGIFPASLLAQRGADPAVQKGLEARQMGHPGEAFLQFKWAAEAGDAYGQYLVAYCYLTAQGTHTDLVAAAKWFRKSADQGYAASEFRLGRCYEYGWGVNPDDAQARKLYQEAAAHGFAGAEKALKELGIPHNDIYEPE